MEPASEKLKVRVDASEGLIEALAGEVPPRLARFIAREFEAELSRLRAENERLIALLARLRAHIDDALGERP